MNLFCLRFLFYTLLLLTIATHSQHAYAIEYISTEHGDVFVLPFSEFKQKESRPVCGKLPPVIQHKAHQTAEGYNFTPEEYKRLAGNSDYLGLRGLDTWYGRDERKVVFLSEAFQPAPAFSSGAYDNYPILCGVSTPEKPMPATNPVMAWKKGEKYCDGNFCGLSGGVYLNAIYNNDLALVKRLDSSLNAQFRKKTGGMLAFAENITGKKQDMSLLPVLADTYIVEDGKGYAPSLQCYKDAVKKTITHTNPTYDVWDHRGMYDGVAGGEVSRYSYIIRPELMSLCDKVCDHLGGAGERSAVRSLGHIGANNTLQGVVEMVKKFPCESKDMLKFEQNLRIMTEQYFENRENWLSQ
jgi:hypothetical protein